MIDIHAHFAEEGYDLEAEWEKIQAAGVSKVVLASDTLEHAKWHRDFANAHKGCYFTAGIHPSEAKKFLTWEKSSTEYYDRLNELDSLACAPKCVAVGEIGLDYHYPDTDKKAQWELFKTQIMLASTLELPLQIHSRDACADTLAVLREHRELLKHGFLMHCYSYGAENLKDFLDLGAYFSFGGVTCFKNARRAVEAVAACPLDRILTETDSPYLSPFRGEKNTPANVPVIVEKLVEIKGVSFYEMYEAIRENAARLFPKLI